MTAALVTWAVCATGLYALSEVWRAKERRERARIEGQLADARADVLRAKHMLDIAAESLSVAVTRDESGGYHLRCTPRTEARKVSVTIGVSDDEAPDGAS